LDAVRIVGFIAEMHERFCCLCMVVLVAVSSSTACKIIESMMRHPVNAMGDLLVTSEIVFAPGRLSQVGVKGTSGFLWIGTMVFAGLAADEILAWAEVHTDECLSMLVPDSHS
jgi:hypothetical protein